PWSVDVEVGVVLGADDGRDGIARDEPKGRARLPAAAEAIDAGHGEDVGLVEVEDAPGLTGMVAAFAAGKGVGQVAEPPLRKGGKSPREFGAVDMPDPVVVEARRKAVFTVYDAVPEVFEVALEAEGNSLCHIVFATDGGVQGADGVEVRVADASCGFLEFGGLRVNAKATLEARRVGQGQDRGGAGIDGPCFDLAVPVGPESRDDFQ